jgi:hypothetical protein
LAFDALGEDDAQFDGVEDFEEVHFGSAAFDVETAEEFFAVGGIEGFVEGDLVFLLNFEARMGQGEGEIAVVGEDEESLTFLIEASDMEGARPVLGEEFEDGFAVAFVVGGADEAPRFEQDGVEGFLDSNDAVADFDGVVGGDDGGEVLDGASVDADASLEDEGFDTAAGAEACGGEEAVKAHGEHRRRRAGIGECR